MTCGSTRLVRDHKLTYSVSRKWKWSSNDVCIITITPGEMEKSEKKALITEVINPKV